MGHQRHAVPSCYYFHIWPQDLFVVLSSNNPSRGTMNTSASLKRKSEKTSSATSSRGGGDTQSRKLDPIQVKVEAELLEQQRLKDSQDQHHQVARGQLESKEKELARIRAENARLQEATIDTLSRTATTAEAIKRETATMEKTRKRRREIALVLREVKKASIVDVCFLVDCTGSMSKYIDEVKSKIQWLVEAISQRHKGVKSLNLAFVGYRDLCDEDRNYSILPFTKSATAFRDFLNKVCAFGGCSHTADVAGGLNQVTKLSWSAPISRVLIHICDVSGHGRDLHVESGLSDPYPGGDPRGEAFRLETLIRKLKRETAISFYVFMRLTELTDKMIKSFKKIATDTNNNADEARGAVVPDGEWLQEMALDSVCDLMSKAMESISASITSMEAATISSHLHGTSSASGGKPAIKPFVLDPEIPRWAGLCAEYVCVYEHELPRLSSDDFKAGRVDVNLLKTPLNVVEKDRLLKIAPRPFAKGGARLAYYGCDVTPFRAPGAADGSSSYERADDGQICVLKEFLREGEEINAKEAYLEQIEIQAVGTHLALQFNKVAPGGTREIKFLKESLVCFEEREKPAFFTKEARILGEYTKFNNNWGYVNHEDYHASLQAFSHWTWHVTDGYMQVAKILAHMHMGTRLIHSCTHISDLVMSLINVYHWKIYCCYTVSLIVTGNLHCQRKKSFFKCYEFTN